jgi:hypothetical protein
MASLNIPDRLNLIKHLGLLVCTTKFRLEVEALLHELTVSPEESEKYALRAENGVIVCNDDSYLKEISPIGDSVRSTINFFIENGAEQYGNDSLYAAAVESFKKVL